MSDATRIEVAIVACAEAFRGDGEIMASPMGAVPALGAKLARLTFEPDLLLSDGVASLTNVDGEVEGWMPYHKVFTTLWSGRRHVMMGASQIDQYGNQNISCVGDWARPKVQLLGARGAPGNTINHTTSYWVPKQSARVLVPSVDMVSGVGYDRAAMLVEQYGESATAFHEIRCVITDLAVLDFETGDGRMRIRSVHPGVSVDEVAAATGFVLEVPDEVPESRLPTDDELRILRDVLGTATGAEE